MAHRPTILMLAAVSFGCGKIASINDVNLQDDEGVGQAIAHWRNDPKQHWGHNENVVQSEIGKVNSVAFSPNSDFLAAAGETGTTRVWDLKNNRVLDLTYHDDVLAPKPPPHATVEWSPQQDILSIGTSSDGVRVWDVRQGKRVAKLPFFWKDVISRFSPDGERLAIGGNSTGGFMGYGYTSTISTWKWNEVPGTMFFWDRQPHRYEVNVERGPVRDTFSIYSMEFSLDNRYFLASGYYHPSADTNRGAVRFGATLSLTALERDKALIRGELPQDVRNFRSEAGDAHGIICIWDVETGELLEEIAPLPDREISALFGAGENWIFYLSEKNTLRVIDGESRSDTLIDFSRDGIDKVRLFTLSLDKKKLVIASDHGDIRVYDAQTLDPTAHFVVPPIDTVTAITISPNNRQLAVGVEDGRVYTWTIDRKAEER